MACDCITVETTPEVVSIETTTLDEVIEVGVVGPQGATGATGATGAAGVGVPTGGITGYALVKKSNTDYDTEWSEVEQALESRSVSLYASGNYNVAQGRRVYLEASLAAGSATYTVTLPRMDANDNAKNGDELYVLLQMSSSNSNCIFRQYVYTGSLPYLGTFATILNVPNASGFRLFRFRLRDFQWGLEPIYNMSAPPSIGEVTPNAGYFSPLYAVDADGIGNGRVQLAADGIASGATRIASFPDKNIDLDDKNDPRTPTAHQSTHHVDDSDPLSTYDLPSILGNERFGEDIDYLNGVVDSLGGAAYLNVGTTAGTVAAGDDARLSDARTPTSHAVSHEVGGSDELFDQNLNTGDIVSFSRVGATDGAVSNGIRIEGSAVIFDDETIQATAWTGSINASAITSGTLDNARVNFAAPASIGSTTRNTGAFTTLFANNGTITASAPVLNLSQTWNNAGVTFTGLQHSITHTAAANGSRLFHILAGTTSLLSARLFAGALITEALAITGPDRGLIFGAPPTTAANSAFFTLRWQTNVAGFARDAVLAWGTAVYDLNYDLAIQRDAADTLAQRRGAIGQTFRIYNTFTSATNFERLNIIAQSAASVIIGTEKGSGGGTARGLELRTDNTARITIGSAGQLGFFGATAAAQPTAVADATDAATAISQLNALLSRMRTLGLIAT